MHCHKDKCLVFAAGEHTRSHKAPIESFLFAAAVCSKKSFGECVCRAIKSSEKCIRRVKEDPT